MRWLRAMERKATAKPRGLVLAISIIAGVVGGIIAGEPSIGFLAGLAVGVADVAAVLARGPPALAQAILRPAQTHAADDIHRWPGRNRASRDRRGCRC